MSDATQDVHIDTELLSQILDGLESGDPESLQRAVAAAQMTWATLAQSGIDRYELAIACLKALLALKEGRASSAPDDIPVVGATTRTRRPIWR